MPQPRILSVGQCAADRFLISGYLQRSFDAKVDSAITHEDALLSLRSGTYDLVLANRIGDRDGRPGLDLIRALKADPNWAEIPIMLVSNYPDSQAEAVALGALAGFGKDGLDDPETIQRLKAALAHPS